MSAWVIGLSTCQIAIIILCVRVSSAHSDIKLGWYKIDINCINLTFFNNYMSNIYTVYPQQTWRSAQAKQIDKTLKYMWSNYGLSGE